MTVTFPEIEVRAVIIQGNRYISQSDLARWLAKLADTTPELKDVFNSMIRQMATAEPIK